MLILGVDTSGKNGSIALVRFEDGGGSISDTLEVVPLEGGTFSAQLVPQIAALLQKYGLSKNKIGGFAVVSGPGSFTGLRVGLAAIKALAEILQKPIAAVSLLEAVATAAELDGPVAAVLDAGRGEIYVGTYDIQRGSVSCVSEELLTLEELRASAPSQQIATPNEKVADVLREGGANVKAVPQPRSDFIARLGYEKIQAGETVSPEALDATYIRRSEAEIKFAGRQS